MKNPKSNSELLAVRVPVALMQWLKALAEKEERDVPELVRSVLRAHILESVESELFGSSSIDNEANK